MAEITLLRHGQASFGSDNYDQLSSIGHQQCLWLGQHFREIGKQFDRVILGTMVRHQETAEGVFDSLQKNNNFELHAGLNEYHFNGLLKPLRSQYPEQWVETNHAKRDYFHNMKLALTYWMQGLIETDGQDSWESFCERVINGFKFAYDSPAKKTLVVSSGGPIAVMLANVLELGADRTRDISLQIKNCSLSNILYNRESFTLDSFNDISHLLASDRQSHITFS